jgi:ferredoxin
MSSAGPVRKPLRAEVSHDLCAGTTMCMQAAPRAFALDAKGQAVFQGIGIASDEALREAAHSCPMGAIFVTEDDDTPAS